jgi:hypothetical protein
MGLLKKKVVNDTIPTETPEPKVKTVSNPDPRPNGPPTAETHKCELPYHRHKQPEYRLGAIIECNECGKKWTLVPGYLQFSWTNGQLLMPDGGIAFAEWSETGRPHKDKWLGLQPRHYQ